MKKLLAIKERPADGGQDAHEKGDGMKRSIAVTRFMSLTPCVSVYCNQKTCPLSTALSISYAAFF